MKTHKLVHLCVMTLKRKTLL